MLPKEKRLTRALFDQVLQGGRSFHSAHLTLRILFVPATKARFAVSVSKKTAKNAVDRNRLRRRAYAVLSRLFPTVERPLPAIVFFKPNAGSLAYEEIKNEIFFLLEKSGLNRRGA